MSLFYTAIRIDIDWKIKHLAAKLTDNSYPRKKINSGISSFGSSTCKFRARWDQIVMSDSKLEGYSKLLVLRFAQLAYEKSYLQRYPSFHYVLFQAALSSKAYDNSLLILKFSGN